MTFMDGRLGTATKRKRHTPSDTAIPLAGMNPTDTLRNVQRGVQARTSQPRLRWLRTRNALCLWGLAAQVLVHLFAMYQKKGAQLYKKVQLQVWM